MGFFSRLGSKIASGIHSAARLGKKALGSVSRVGHKIASGAEKVVNVVDRIPIVGRALAPVSGVVRTGIGLVRDVANVAGKGKELIEEGDQIVSKIEGGDISGAIGQAKSKLEKGKELKADATKILQDTQKLVKDVRRR
tara:strand:- start:5283 stop:5699 length:417 start_codon:yes stop_codon:yes gene_type:complete